jgi:hypothetical protein
MCDAGIQAQCGKGTSAVESSGRTTVIEMAITILDIIHRLVFYLKLSSAL